MEEIYVIAIYCLYCIIKPCSLKGCPLEINIPDFIKDVKEENTGCYVGIDRNNKHNLVRRRLK